MSEPEITNILGTTPGEYLFINLGTSHHGRLMPVKVTRDSLGGMDLNINNGEKTYLLGCSGDEARRLVREWVAGEHDLDALSDLIETAARRQREVYAERRAKAAAAKAKAEARRAVVRAVPA